MSIERMPSMSGSDSGSLLAQGLRAARLAILALLAMMGGPLLRGNEPPTPLQIEQYRRDGTLEARILAAKEIGNHKVDPALMERASRRLRNLVAPTGAELPTPPGGWAGMPTTGTVRVMILLVDFSDYPHDDTKNSQAKVQARIFGDGDTAAAAPYESLRNYYRRASYNQLELTGSVLGWYRPAYTRASMAQTTAARQNLIKEALDHYNGLGHDFAQYDNHGDGKIDYFAVIWSGPDNGWSNFWWGYQTSWSNTTTPLTLDGKTLGKYSWQWESRPVGGNFIPKVLIHETGHALGLPDYYDYDDAVGPRGGVGGLDMMDGNWGDHNCFSKFLLDWITPSVYTAATIGVSLRASGNFGDAAIVMPDATPGNAFGEFFMVQNRKRVQNDITYPTDGLLIWHVDSRLNASSSNYLYDNSYTAHKLLRLMEADGLEQIELDQSANAGDFWINGKTFGPQALLPNSSRYDGTWSWIGITSISVPGDAMTFNVFTLPPDTTAPLGAPSTPTIGTSPSTGTLAYQWTQGTASDPDSGITGYQLQVGTTPGGNDFFDGLVGNTLTMTFTSAGQDGSTYYARVRAINGASLYSGWSGVSPGIQVVYPTFPCDTVEACPLVIKTTGNVGWTSQTLVTHGTASAAQSGAIGDQSSSILQTTVVGPGSLSFWWKVSSEPGYDYLSFSIDGTQQLNGAISGETAWAEKTYAIPAGSHLVRWTFAKDENTIGGQDKAWVDQVTFTASGSTITSVAVAPLTANLGPGATQQFTATVLGTGGFSTAVTWSASGGSISASGLYTAPAGAGTFTVTATSVQDNSKLGTASVTVTVPSTITSVAVAPLTANLGPSATQQFTATVLGTGGFSTAVIWSASGGSISASGLYTAPAGAGSYSVTATSVQDNSKFGTATVTVTGLAPVISSFSASPSAFQPGSSVVLSWTVSGAASLSLNNGVGTVTGTSAVVTPQGSSDVVFTLTASNAAGATNRNVVVAYRPRDFNGDGVTDILDLATFARAFGATPSSSNWIAAADLNGDNIVDDTDLTLFLAGL